MTPAIVELRERLANLEACHDTSFEYSDDQAAWRRGRDTLTKIHDLRQQILALTEKEKTCSPV